MMDLHHKNIKWILGVGVACSILLLADDPVETKDSKTNLKESICLFFNVEKLGLNSSDSKRREGDFKTLIILLIVHDIPIALFPIEMVRNNITQNIYIYLKIDFLILNYTLQFHIQNFELLHKNLPAINISFQKDDQILIPRPNLHEL